jgi:hypothetical protein
VSPNAPDTPLGAAVVGDAARQSVSELRALEAKLARGVRPTAAELSDVLRRAARNLDACTATIQSQEHEIRRVRHYGRAMGDLVDGYQERLL